MQSVRDFFIVAMEYECKQLMIVISSDVKEGARLIIGDCIEILEMIVQ